MPYRVPDDANPRVQRTRNHLLTAARELLAETGPVGLTYSTLAERAGVTRQTVYRHWPSRAALLVDLMLGGPAADYPEPGTDPYAVAVDWLLSMRAGMGDQARRAAILAVTAQADTDEESSQALSQIVAGRLAALNELLKPSGTQLAPEEYALLTGPLLARIFFERGPVSDAFIHNSVSQWLAGRDTALDETVRRRPPR